MANSVLSLVFPLSARARRCRDGCDGPGCDEGEVEAAAATAAAVCPDLPRPQVARGMLRVVEDDRFNFGLLTSSRSDGDHITAFLFQAALTAAELAPPGSRRRVVFISSAARRWTRLPPAVHAMPRPDRANMRAITFVYPESADEAVAYLTTLGGLPPADLPAAVIVDDLEGLASGGLGCAAADATAATLNADGTFFANSANDEGREKSFTLLCSALHHLGAHLAAVSPDARVVAGLSLGGDAAPPPLLNKMHFWFDEIWALTSAAAENSAELEMQLACRSVEPPHYVHVKLKDHSYFFSALEREA